MCHCNWLTTTASTHKMDKKSNQIIENKDQLHKQQKKLIVRLLTRATESQKSNIPNQHTYKIASSEVIGKDNAAVGYFGSAEGSCY